MRRYEYHNGARWVGTTRGSLRHDVAKRFFKVMRDGRELRQERRDGTILTVRCVVTR